jgi:hypothetical protein
MAKAVSGIRDNDEQQIHVLSGDPNKIKETTPKA